MLYLNNLIMYLYRKQNINLKFFYKSKTKHLFRLSRFSNGTQICFQKQNCFNILKLFPNF